MPQVITVGRGLIIIVWISFLMLKILFPYKEIHTNVYVRHNNFSINYDYIVKSFEKGWYINSHSCNFYPSFDINYSFNEIKNILDNKLRVFGYIVLDDEETANKYRLLC